MVGYAARAVPWFRVVLAAGLVVLLLELVRWNPWVLWPLEGTAVGLLAGAAAWCFDETAAVVVDAAPRSLAWRTAVRSPAVLLLAVTWVAVVAHADAAGALFGQGGAVLVQGLAAMAAGGAYACWRRAQGQALPGLLLASAVVPATTVWALVRPFETHLAVFPYGTDSAATWTASGIGWGAAGVAALVVGAAALGDAPWWAARRRAVA